MTRQQTLFGEGQPELPGVEGAAAITPIRTRSGPSFCVCLLRSGRPRVSRGTHAGRSTGAQMTNWLPDVAAAQLRFEFETEIRRLDAA
jgi:hypothetical protein